MSNLSEFLNSISLICLSNLVLNSDDFDKRLLINYFKFLKQICIIINNNNTAITLEQNKSAVSTIETYINNSIGKYLKMISKDEELNKKYEKVKTLLSNVTDNDLDKN